MGTEPDPEHNAKIGDTKKSMMVSSGQSTDEELEEDHSHPHRRRRRLQPEELDLSYSNSVDNAFLFNLSCDESEQFNLLNAYLPNYDEALNIEVVSRCTNVMEHFIENNELFSNPIAFLHTKLDQANPATIEDGQFVRPFLDNSQYASLVRKMFNDEDKNGHFHSEQQQALYFYAWISPQRMDDEMLQKGSDDALGNKPILIILIVIILAALVVIASTIIIVYKCSKRKSNHDRYELIGDGNVEYLTNQPLPNGPQDSNYQTIQAII